MTESKRKAGIMYIKYFYPGNRTGVFTWKISNPVARILDRKVRYRGNRASLPSHLSASKVLQWPLDVN